jgi:DNA-binding response OmpR family regulator
MPHVLLIEDDARIREIVERGLGSRGLVVTSAEDGPTGLDLARKLEVDVVLLDLMLPGMSGLEVLEEIRLAKPRLPVVALTALDDTRSKVAGLDAGADDYLTKPFSLEELAARVRARLRAKEDAGALKAGPLTVDPVAHRAVLNGREVPLSARELALLAAFVRHTGQVLSRSQLLDMVWDLDFDPGSNVVEVYVAADGLPLLGAGRGAGPSPVRAAAVVLGGSLLFFLAVLTGAGRHGAVPVPTAIALGVPASQRRPRPVHRRHPARPGPPPGLRAAPGRARRRLRR